jgi:hypothetical protein
MMIEVTHARTPEAAARCKFGPGSCHDCAMTCPHGNTVKDANGTVHPCGSDVYRADGTMIFCGQCVEDRQ